MTLVTECIYLHCPMENLYLVKIEVYSCKMLEIHIAFFFFFFSFLLFFFLCACEYFHMPFLMNAMVQVGLRVPTPLVVGEGLFSCEFLVQLQELCLQCTGILALPGARDRLVAAREFTLAFHTC